MNARNDSQPESEHNSIEIRINTWWYTFSKQVPNNTAGWGELFKRCQENRILNCKYCQSSNLQLIANQRKFRCNQCNRATSLTGKGIFYRVREIRAWLATLSAFEAGLSLSSLRLAKLTGIAQSTALNILKRFKIVMNKLLAESDTEISSAFFCRLYGRRSRETPARRHPIAEQEELDKQLMRDNLSINTAKTINPYNNTVPKPAPPTINLNSQTPSLTTEQKLVFEALSRSSMYFDQICESTKLPAAEVNAALTYLEIYNLIHCSFGDKFTLYNDPASTFNNKLTATNANNTQTEHGSKTPLTAALMELIESVEDAIRSVHQRVSRKFIQPYIAEKIYLLVPPSKNSPTLFRACIESAPISYEELLNYVSPPNVKIRPTAGHH